MTTLLAVALVRAEEPLPLGRYATPRLLYPDPSEGPGPLLTCPLVPETSWTGARPVYMPWGVLLSLASVFDINEDGLKDIIMREAVHLHTGEYRGDIPVFSEVRKLAEFVDYDTPEVGPSPRYKKPYHGSHCFGDLDGDGRVDIVTGSKEKPYRWWKGMQRKNGRRQFKCQGSLIEASARGALEPLMESNCAPTMNVVDWDSDGLPDLIIGYRLIYYASPLKYRPLGGYGWGKGFAGKTWLGGDPLGMLVFHKNVGTREEPRFTVGHLLRVGEDEHLAMSYANASPAVLDYNGDGLLDIVACMNDRLVYYPNVGTPAEPRLDDAVLIRLDGNDTLPYQGLSFVHANWKEGDPNHFLFGSAQFVYHVQNRGSVAKPDYTLSGPVLQTNAPLLVDSFAMPHVADWNGDGKPDLLVGDEHGFVTYFENRSAASPPEPDFRRGKVLTVDGKRLRYVSDFSMSGPDEGLLGYANPIARDWDHDGDLDLLVGVAEPILFFYENVGSRTEPRLAAGVKMTVNGELLPHDQRTRPTADDWNDDGLLDLMVVTKDGRLRYYERQREGDKLTLKEGVVINDVEGEPLYLRGGEGRRGGRVKLTAVDWDKDMDLDMIVGSRDGKPNPGYWENRGSNRKPVFECRGKVPIPIVGRHFTLVEPYDWDHDGDLDVITSSDSGGIFYIERTR